jgi:hypothetical protein
MAKMTFSPGWCYEPGLKGPPARSAQGGHVENRLSRVVAQSGLNGGGGAFSPDFVVPIRKPRIKAIFLLVDIHHHEPATRQHSLPSHSIDHISNHQCYGPSPRSCTVPPSLLDRESTPPQPHCRTTSVTHDR